MLKSNCSQINPVRVANLIEEGRWGGPQKRITLVAGQLRQLNVETTVFLPTAESESFRQALDEVGVYWKAFSLRRLGRGWRVIFAYLFDFPREIFHLWRELKHGNYDLVHISGGAWQYKGVIAAKLAGKKVIWQLNDASLPSYLRLVFLLLAPLADGYIYSALRAKVYYKNYIPIGRHEYIINPPVDTLFYSPNENYFYKDEELNRVSKKVVIGMIANINPIKGIEVFIDMAATLNQRFDNLAFIVIGSIYSSQSTYFAILQARIKSQYIDNLHFLGARDDVRPWLNRFDIYVCSSNSETGPMTLWEAMSMEKAVVSTDVGDVSMYVRDGESGFVVNVDDSDEMADKVALLIRNTTLRNEFGKKARQIAVRELDISSCANSYFAAYRETLAHKF